MADIVLSTEELDKLARQLIGFPVSLPWKGYGSAIFLELGALAPLESKRQHHNKGEACIAIEWDWRVEERSAVLYGSSDSRPRIEAGIQSLRGSTVETISVLGTVPELVVRFSNGNCLRSMAMTAGGPQWSIKLRDGRWIDAENGNLLAGEGASSLTAEEESAFTIAERAAGRWGTPGIEPMPGPCARCLYFIALDGEGHFLDYGCCAAESGPFDGRVVARNSGCPSFAVTANS